MIYKQNSTHQFSLDFQLETDTDAENANAGNTNTGNVDAGPKNVPHNLSSLASLQPSSSVLDGHPSERLSKWIQPLLPLDDGIFDSNGTGDRSDSYPGSYPRGNSPNDGATPKAKDSVVEYAIASGDDDVPSEPYLLPSGSIFTSPGGHFTYRVLGACCRLYDREELPWPCCRLQWHTKEPSWRRIGKRFVPDLATKRAPSYMVEILDQEYSKSPFVLTLYWIQFTPKVQNWWYQRYVPPSTL